MPAIHEHIIRKNENRRLPFLFMLEILIAPFAHDVPKQNASLHEVYGIFNGII
ncbi:Uncharacterised protein [Legionella pneumophila]|nr:Uncharacterised protein [Legionella pneumophila]